MDGIPLDLPEAEKYRTRLNRASRIEYKKFWSGYRLLVTFAGLLAPLLIQLQRGVHSMLSLGDAMESGAIGLFLSLSGTYLYSRRKGAEALDAERETEIRNRDTKIAEQEGKIQALAKPPRTGAEQHYYEIAKLALARHGQEAMKILYENPRGDRVYGLDRSTFAF